MEKRINLLANFLGFTRRARELNLPDTDRAIYFELLNENNVIGLDVAEFRLSNALLEMQAGSSERKVRDAKNRLKQAGLIDFKVIGTGRGATNIFRLTPLKSNGRPNDDQMPTERRPNGDAMTTDSRPNGDRVATDSRQKTAENVAISIEESHSDAVYEAPKSNKRKENQSKENSSASSREKKFDDENFARVVSEFQKKLRPLVPNDAENLADLIDEFSVDRVLKAIEAADIWQSVSKKRIYNHVKYLRSILIRMRNDEIGGGANGRDIDVHNSNNTHDDNVVFSGKRGDESCSEEPYDWRTDTSLSANERSILAEIYGGTSDGTLQPQC